MAIGRIGDVINGEHHGAHAQGFPLAVVYTNPNTLGEIGVPGPPGRRLRAGHGPADLRGPGLARPRRRQRSDGRWRFDWNPRFPRDGMLFWVYLCVYSLGRFVIQFYRVDTPFALGLSQAQLLSVLTAMVAVWMLVYQIQRARKLGPSGAYTRALLRASTKTKTTTTKTRRSSSRRLPAPSRSPTRNPFARGVR